MELGLAPFAPFFAGAVLAAVLRGRTRAAVTLLIPLLGAANLFFNAGSLDMDFQILGITLMPVRVDELSLLFGYLFHLAAFIGVLFALHVEDSVQQAAAQAYAGSAIGAAFAGDLITLFVFWELLGLSSVFLIWARRTPRALATGLRYLTIQVSSGILLLTGGLWWSLETGSIGFDHIGLDGPASWLIFLAFGIKCAFPLLHNWLTDAYPEATPTGTVFLSAFTTKVAIYALARGFAGTELLIYIGAVMTCFPIFYAVIEDDLRRVLAYSMINQVGFMVCGIGVGTALAVNGAVAHAFNDVIFKGLLMMSMGAVLYRTGKIRGSDLGGLHKSMPFTTAFCIVGAASISAFPLFSGFVSKAMVMVAVLQEGHYWVWLALLFASAGVFHHAGIKIPFFAFFSFDSGIRTREAPLNMLLAMGLAASLCIFIGSWPWWLYDLLPYQTGYSPFETSHIISQLQLLFFSALAFVWLKLSGIYPPELPSVNIDAEWVYRWLGPRLIRATGRGIVRVDTALRSRALVLANATLREIQRYHGPAGVLARGWQIGTMVFLVLTLLGLLLIGEYL